MRQFLLIFVASFTKAIAYHFGKDNYNRRLNSNYTSIA